MYYIKRRSGWRRARRIGVVVSIIFAAIFCVVAIIFYNGSW